MTPTPHKIIYWRHDLPRDGNGNLLANVHIIICYNQGSLADFQEMAGELRKTFPQAEDGEICGRKIYKSSTVDGGTIISWGARIPQGDYPDWRQVNDGSGWDYCF